jgi:hypothetical protein
MMKVVKPTIESVVSAVLAPAGIEATYEISMKSKEGSLLTCCASYAVAAAQ